MTPDDFLAYIRSRITNDKHAAEVVALLLAERLIESYGGETRFFQWIIDELEDTVESGDPASDDVPF
jgi:hypothetical protein